jgi:hypothetical protein
MFDRVARWQPDQGAAVGIAALSVESVIVLLVLLAGLGAWHARIHAASVAAARRPVARRTPQYSRPA